MLIMTKKGSFFVLKVTFTPEGPVGELLEDLGTNSYFEAEEILFEKYLKDENDIVIKNGRYVNDIIYKGRKIAGFARKELVPAGEITSMLRTENGFISLYAKPLWDEYFEENPGEIYLIEWDDDEWKEQIKFL